MKALLAPVYFKLKKDEEFTIQLKRLKELLSEEADILPPAVIGSELPEADAVLFPQLLGDAFKKIEAVKKIKMPMLAVTSEFGTVAMWDWEIVSFLKAEGLKVFAPYNLEMTKTVCRGLAIKRELKKTKFAVYQDNPGEGMQASIFKRFYWWEDRCTKLMKEKFGVSIKKNSFKALGEKAKKITGARVDNISRQWKQKTTGVSDSALSSAVKLYIALKSEIEKDDSIKGAGINCLNESFYSDTTPCLAWNMLFEENEFIWACEADTISLMTTYILYKTLREPVMMSNLYPFLMGMAALKHEKIKKFPEVNEPENHLLAAHCGYLGVLPESFSESWSLKPRVLEITNENATAIDARLPVGGITLAKLHPGLNRLMVAEGELEDYAQYPGSDCRNGAVIRVKNGSRLMDKLYSHHCCIIKGHPGDKIKIISEIFDLEIDEV
jgi:hypothetical protein